MAVVGIIANPASGKDIRRLVAYGTVFDNQEKVNIVRRALLGLAATGVRQVVYMPDYYGIVPKALDGLSSQHRLSLEVNPVDMELTGTQIDSYKAAVEMNRLGVGCMIVLGVMAPTAWWPRDAVRCRWFPFLPEPTMSFRKWWKEQ